MSNNRDLSVINGFWVDKEHDTFLNAIFHDEHTLAIDIWKGHPNDEKYEAGAVAGIRIDLRTGKITLVKGEN